MKITAKVLILFTITRLAIFMIGGYSLNIGGQTNKFENELGIVSVEWFGAKGDGITDDTKAIQKAIDNVPEGSIIKIPPGKYKCNITIIKSNITIIGERGNRNSGSYLIPFDTTKPCIQIGNGEEAVRNISLDNITLMGTNDSSHSNSVGLRIYGIHYLYTNGLNIESFGGNNIEIDSGNIPSSYLYFNNFRTANSHRSGFYVNYGASWVSAIFLNNFSAQIGQSDTSRCITLKDKVLLDCSNGWIQSKNYKGIDLYGDPSISLTNVNIDSDNSNDVLVKQFDKKTSALNGLFNLDGYIENSEGIKMPIYGSGYVNHQTLSDPLVYGNIFLIDKNKLNSEEDYIPTGDNRIVLGSDKLYFYSDGEYFYFDGDSQQLRNFATHGGNSINRPFKPIKYQQYYDVDLKKLIIYDGTNWRDTMGNIVDN